MSETRETQEHDYITSMREELENLEGRLERAELIAQRAEREIPDLQRRRRNVVVDAVLGDETASSELEEVDPFFIRTRVHKRREMNGKAAIGGRRPAPSQPSALGV